MRATTLPKSIDINLDDLDQELKCPICLNIFTETQITSECLHRFCRACINDCLRLGKKECPTCRVKCNTKRSTRPDPRFDALIKLLHGTDQKTETFATPSMIHSYENMIKKRQKAIRAGFVPGIFDLSGVKRDWNDAESLSSTSDVAPFDLYVEFLVESVEKDTKAIAVRVPAIGRVEDIIRVLQEQLKTKKPIRVGIKRRSIAWLDKNKSIKAIKTKQLIYS